MDDRVTGMRSSGSQSDLERAMEGKISKSGKGGLKAPTSAFVGAKPGSSRSGIVREDSPGRMLTMEAIGGRLLELEAMVKSMGSRVGKDRRLDGQGEDLDERDRVARRTLERAQLVKGPRLVGVLAPSSLLGVTFYEPPGDNSGWLRTVDPYKVKRGEV